MAIFGSLIALLKADSSGWKKGMAEAREEVDKTSKKTGNFFKDLSSSFGKKSMLGQSLKLAAGGGAIGALSLAANEVKGFADKINALKKEMADGKAGAGEMVEEIAKGIPVFGRFYEAGRAWREVITGENAELAKQNQYVEEVNASIKAHVDLARRAKEESKQWAEQVKKVRDELEVIRAEPKARPLITAQQNSANEFARQKAQFLKESGLDDDGELTQGQKQLENAQKKLTALDSQLKAVKDRIAAGEGGNDEERNRRAENVSQMLQLQQEQEAKQKELAGLQSRVDDLRNVARRKENEFKIARGMAGDLGAAQIAEITKEATEKWMRERRELELEQVTEIETFRKNAREKHLQNTLKEEERQMTGLEEAKRDAENRIHKDRELRESSRRVATAEYRRFAAGTVATNDLRARPIEKEHLDQLKLINSSIKTLNVQMEYVKDAMENPDTVVDFGG